MAAKISKFWNQFTGRKAAPAEEDSYSIQDAWREHFTPVVRKAGFKGSGRHFRRVTGEIVEAINLQGARHGGKFAVNLGLQPLAIPDVMGNPVDQAKLKEIDCEFRRRLSARGADQWWDYTSRRSTIDAAARAAARVFEAHALPILARMTAPSSPLLCIDPVAFDTGMYDFSGFGSTKVRMARTLSLLRRAHGDLPASRAFARIALDNLGSASALRAELAKLAETV